MIPTRRQLLERAQLAGLKIEPWIEVEHVESALDLVARGIGDTIVCQAVCRSAVFPVGLHTVPFAEPLYDTIALVQRVNGVLSPGHSGVGRAGAAHARRSRGSPREVRPGCVPQGRPPDTGVIDPALTSVGEETAQDPSQLGGRIHREHVAGAGQGDVAQHRESLGQFGLERRGGEI